MPEHASFSRRGIIAWTAAGVLVPAAAGAADVLRRTPGEPLGPYYPVQGPLPATHDLTHGGKARGELLHVSGRVLNRQGRPAARARIDVWQANAAGRYAHPSDRSGLPLDPGFRGAATFLTDAEGRYAFLTVKPGPYPGERGMRTRHIHFQVTGRSDRLVTQAYFPGEALNASDPFLSHELRPQDLMLRLGDDTAGRPREARFDLILGVG
jgi:protocatechuate 3,4-dioxygenase beta subunit